MTHLVKIEALHTRPVKDRISVIFSKVTQEPPVKSCLSIGNGWRPTARRLRDRGMDRAKGILQCSNAKKAHGLGSLAHARRAKSAYNLIAD